MTRKFAPRRFDKFDQIPSVGASGGILVIWNSASFPGCTTNKLQFGLTIALTCQHTAETWKLTIVYGPCVEPERSDFVNWLNSHNIDDEENWLFLGDFNFYRSLEDWNQLGGNLQHTLIFNNIIGHLGLIELPLKGKAFTWSNMQQNPSQSSSIGFFPQLTGHQPTQTPWFCPLLKLHQTLYLKISIGTKHTQVHIP